MSAFETAGSLLTSIETTTPDKAGYDTGLDSHDPAIQSAGKNEMIWQAIQSMKGGWTTIRPAREVNYAGVLIQEAWQKTTVSIFLADTASAGEKPVIGGQSVQSNGLRHGDALATRSM